MIKGFTTSRSLQTRYATYISRVYTENISMYRNLLWCPKFTYGKVSKTIILNFGSLKE